MGIRDFVKAVSPPFLIGPGTPGAPLPATAGIAERFMYALSFGCDAILEKINEAVSMHFPGYGDASALPYTGADRGIVRGLYETDANYAARLQRYLDTWHDAGTARSVIQQIAWYVYPVEPLLGSYLEGVNETRYDLLADGSNPDTDPTVTHAVPPDQQWDQLGYYKRRFFFIKAWGTASGTTWAPSGTVFGAAGYVFGDLTKSIGYNLPPQVATDLRAMVAQWQCAGTRYPWIVIIIVDGWSGTTSGTWANWSKIDTSGTRPVRVPARDSKGLYISGPVFQVSRKVALD